MRLLPPLLTLPGVLLLIYPVVVHFGQLCRQSSVPLNGSPLPMAESPLHVSTLRSFSAHLMLQRAAKEALRSVGPGNLAPMSAALVALSMSAFAVEAMCNALGAKRYAAAQWEAFVWLPPAKKLRKIGAEFGVQISDGKEPWKSVLALMKFRDGVVHAKPYEIARTEQMTREQFEQLPRLVESPLETQLTEGYATNAVERVAEMQELFAQRLQDHEKAGFIVESQFWMARGA